jgi:hypothetical protein
MVTIELILSVVQKCGFQKFLELPTTPGHPPL